MFMLQLFRAHLQFLSITAIYYEIIQKYRLSAEEIMMAAKEEVTI